jgi:hypothetical protein
VGVLDTTNVTLTVCEGDPADAIVTLPLYVPALVKLEVRIETLMELGAVPEPELTDNHEPPEVVAVVAVNAVPEVPPIVIGCATGAAAPI